MRGGYVPHQVGNEYLGHQACFTECVAEPGRGVEVDELEDGLYLFRFEHQLDVRKVMDKGP
ncbi:hypothetical protein LINGRAHAP2_LOCUS35577 [Linum grandiflorum]